MGSLDTSIRKLSDSMLGSFRQQGVNTQELDYSERSVAALDGLITILEDTGDPVNPRHALGFGAYLGEVVIRNLGGSWQARSETEFVVVQPNGTVVRPVRAAEDRISRGRSARLPDWYGSLKPERKRFWQR